jgi:Type II secretion system (T2SS), protein G
MPKTASGSSVPLILLAVLSFVPGLGILFGSAAVTWGLLSSRPHAKLAIGIGATGALLQFLVAVGFAFRMRAGSPGLDQALAESARRDLVRVVDALENYHRQEARYPSTLLDLSTRRPFPRPISIFDQSAGLSFRLRPFQYRVAADGASYDLFAVGPDGKPGTADDIRPVLPDSLRQRSGFLPAP